MIFEWFCESTKYQFVTDFTSFIVIDEPSEPEPQKPESKPDVKPEEKAEDAETDAEKGDSLEKKFINDLNNQFSKTKKQPPSIRSRTSTSSTQKPAGKKIIAPSKKTNTGAVFGDPHFIIFDKNEEPICFNYQPKAISSMITLVRDPHSNLEINATVTGKRDLLTRIWPILYG